MRINDSGYSVMIPLILLLQTTLSAHMSLLHYLYVHIHMCSSMYYYSTAHITYLEHTLFRHRKAQ